MLGSTITIQLSRAGCWALKSDINCCGDTSGDLILIKAEVNDRPVTLVLDTGSSHTILSTKLLQVDLPTLEQAGDSSKGSGWFGRAGWIKATVKVGIRYRTITNSWPWMLFPIFPDGAARKFAEF